MLKVLTRYEKHCAEESKSKVRGEVDTSPSVVKTRDHTGKGSWGAEEERGP